MIFVVLIATRGDDVVALFQPTPTPSIPYVHPNSNRNIHDVTDSTRYDTHTITNLHVNTNIHPNEDSDADFHIGTAFSDGEAGVGGWGITINGRPIW